VLFAEKHQSEFPQAVRDVAPMETKIHTLDVRINSD